MNNRSPKNEATSFIRDICFPQVATIIYYNTGMARLIDNRLLDKFNIINTHQVLT